MVAKTNKLAVVAAVLAQLKRTRLKTPLVLAHLMQANVMTIAKTSVMPMVFVLMVSNLRSLLVEALLIPMGAKINNSALVTADLVLLKPTRLLEHRVLVLPTRVNVTTIHWMLVMLKVYAKMDSNLPAQLAVPLSMHQAAKTNKCVLEAAVHVQLKPTRQSTHFVLVTPMPVTVTMTLLIYVISMVSVKMESS